MATYFIGRRRVGSFILYPHSGAVLSCNVFERWEDIDLSSTARCGVAGSIEVRKEVGLSERDHHTLKVNVEGSIGVEAIASLKSKVEETVGREVNWSLARATTQTFSFTAEKCGRHSETIYQMVREYELSYKRKRFFGSESWERTVRERTQCHDAVPDIEDWDEACKCPKPTRRDYDGRLQLDMGDLSMRVPFRRTPEGIEINFGGKFGIIQQGSTQEFPDKIPVGFLPEVLRFLGDVRTEYVECIFSPYRDPISQYRLSITDFADLSSKLEESYVAAPRMLREGES